MELILIHKNDSGITPLYIACVRDNLEIVNYLINEGHVNIKQINKTLKDLITDGISGRIRIQENTMEIMNLLYLHSGEIKNGRDDRADRERFFNPDITHQELTYIFNELE